MSSDRQYFDPDPGEQIDPSDLEYDAVGEDMPPDDAPADTSDEVGPGDDLIALFDVSSDDARKELFMSGMFQDWLKAILKQNNIKPVPETAPTVQGYNGINPAALRLAQKATALWAKDYP